MERRIGEMFYSPTHKCMLKVVKSQFCAGCVYENVLAVNECTRETNISGECRRQMRSDKTSVNFQKV